MRYKYVHKDVFEDMDKVFKEMDTIFKAMGKNMEDMMESIQAEATPEPWQKWFAWHPVTIKGKRRWLKSVYRRNSLKVGMTGITHAWEYGDMFDVLKEAGNGTKHSN